MDSNRPIFDNEPDRFFNGLYWHATLIGLLTR